MCSRGTDKHLHFHMVREPTVGLYAPEDTENTFGTYYNSLTL